MANAAASATLYYTVFSSPDLDLLVELCGYRNRYEALGRLATLYSRITSAKTNVADKALMIQCFGPNGPEAFPMCGDLAERMENGTVRVRGARRTEWYGDREVERQAGGRARMAKAERDVRGRLISSSRPPGEQLDHDQQRPAIHQLSVQPQGSGIRDQGDLLILDLDQVPPDLGVGGSGGTAPRPAEQLESSGKDGKAKPKRRISPDWQPSDKHRELARALGHDCDAQAEQFRDHYLGKGEPRADWDASFRTWLRNCKRFGAHIGKANAQIAAGRVEPRAAGDYPEGDIPL